MQRSKRHTSTLPKWSVLAGTCLLVIGLWVGYVSTTMTLVTYENIQLTDTLPIDTDSSFQQAQFELDNATYTLSYHQTYTDQLQEDFYYDVTVRYHYWNPLRPDAEIIQLRPKGYRIQTEGR